MLSQGGDPAAAEHHAQPEDAAGRELAQSCITAFGDGNSEQRWCYARLSPQVFRPPAPKRFSCAPSPRPSTHSSSGMRRVLLALLTSTSVSTGLLIGGGGGGVRRPGGVSSAGACRSSQSLLMTSEGSRLGSSSLVGRAAERAACHSSSAPSPHPPLHVLRWPHLCACSAAQPEHEHERRDGIGQDVRLRRPGYHGRGHGQMPHQGGRQPRHLEPERGSLAKVRLRCSLGSAPARLLCLLRARLAAPGSSALPGRSSVLPGRSRPTERLATASTGPRSSCLESRQFHRV